MGCKGVPHVDDIDSSGCSLNTITIKKINENIAVLGFNLCSKFSKSNPRLYGSNGLYGNHLAFQMFKLG